jgi:WD40-like Beta Propeller Repeat
MIVSLRYCSLYLLFFTLLTAKAIAQEMKFSDPVLLSPLINTANEEVNPLLSWDGKNLYFVRAFYPQNKGGKGAGTDVWVSQLDNQANWMMPTNKFRWNNKLNNAVVGVRKDDKVVYLLNSYNNKSGIAFSKYLNGDWTTPEVISIPNIEKLDFVGFYMNPSFSILLISMVKDDSYGKEDLYVSVKDSLDVWSTPLNLGSTINTSGFEIAPFLSEDGKRLYFTSDGHKGFGGADIFMAERLHDSWTTWSRPRNLGNKVNSEKFDSYFSVHDSTCFFVSNRSSEFSDIYQSRMEKVKKVDLKDSVNRIIEEAKKLLGEIDTAPTSIETIEFPVNSFTLNASLKNQIKKWISRFDVKLVSNIELLNSKVQMSFEQINEVTNYLVSIGISKSKIKNISNSKTTPKIKGTMEIRIYLKKN